MGQEQKATQINAAFPWRVPLGQRHLQPPPGRWSEMEEIIRVKPLAWCEDRFGPRHDDPRPASSPPPIWSYRFEYVGIVPDSDDRGGVVLYEDAFYFRREDDAFEFKMRWG